LSFIYYQLLSIFGIYIANTCALLTEHKENTVQSSSLKLACVAALSITLPMSAHAVATLQNGYVLAGVSDYGTLGSNGNASPGIL
jgi:hypothetical protein